MRMNIAAYQCKTIIQIGADIVYEFPNDISKYHIEISKNRLLHIRYWNWHIQIYILKNNYIKYNFSLILLGRLVEYALLCPRKNTTKHPHGT